MKAFVTGSHAYGKPTKKSDIDLVIHVSKKDFERLAAMADLHHDFDHAYEQKCITKCLRFGKLNLLCCLEEGVLNVWRAGTSQLKKKAPVNRDEACDLMDKLRTLYLESLDKEET